MLAGKNWSSSRTRTTPKNNNRLIMAPEINQDIRGKMYLKKDNLTFYASVSYSPGHVPVLGLGGPICRDLKNI